MRKFPKMTLKEYAIFVYKFAWLKEIKSTEEVDDLIIKYVEENGFGVDGYHPKYIM